MNFLQSLKRSLNSPENRTGVCGKCTVEANMLRELIHHFERLDGLERIDYLKHKPMYDNTYQFLYEVVRFMLIDKKQDPHKFFSDLFNIMQTVLKDIIDEKAAITYFDYPYL